MVWALATFDAVVTVTNETVAASATHAAKNASRTRFELRAAIVERRFEVAFGMTGPIATGAPDRSGRIPSTYER